MINILANIAMVAVISASLLNGWVTEDSEDAPPINDFKRIAIDDDDAYIDELLSDISTLLSGVERLKSELDDALDEIDVLNDKLAKYNTPKTPVNAPTSADIFETTYYSAYCPTCGQWGGITATGDDISSSIYVRGNRVIAVDPSVIPLHSLVRVTTPYETFEALALDTGGDIKGKRVDILVESAERAYELGRHNVTVEILRKGK